MFNVGKTYKPTVIEYDSRRGHIPNNLAELNASLGSILLKLLSRDLGNMPGLVAHHQTERTFSCGKNMIFYTIQKYSKKRIDSNKKRIGDQGKPVTNFVVAYKSHIIVRCHIVPKVLISSYTQYPKHFVVNFKTYQDIAKALCSR